ncbi:MAG: glycosyltransferase [Bacteroidetes bacterium]|nr:glycosyltransferase [Bacteroidota bacterium]
MDQTVGNTPLISVVMPVYNAGVYVREAIESILSQTCRDFELIIINDGSTDDSIQYIRAFHDDRIVYVENPGNKGLIYTLNKGIELARGAYIARMDADDICDPSRFEKQLREFQKDPELVICGSYIQTFGKREAKIDYMPSTHAEIMASVFISCPFAHPSVMLRKSALLDLEEIYRADYKHAEDYDLWSRLVFRGHTFNIPEFLLHYREHDKQVSTVFETVKYQTVGKIQRNLLNRLGLNPTEAELAIHLNIFKGISRQDMDYLKQNAAWFKKFHDAFMVQFSAFSVKFNRILASRWLKIGGNSGLGLKGLKFTLSQPFFSAKYVNFKDLIKIVYKSLTGYKQVEG